MDISVIEVKYKQHFLLNTLIILGNLFCEKLVFWSFCWKSCTSLKRRLKQCSPILRRILNVGKLKIYDRWLWWCLNVYMQRFISPLCLLPSRHLTTFAATKNAENGSWKIMLFRKLQVLVLSSQCMCECNWERDFITL